MILFLACPQLKEVMMRENAMGTVLSLAAGSGSKDTFEAVVAALEDKLENTEVRVYSSTSLVVPLTCYREVGRWRTAIGPWDRNVMATILRT